MVATLVTPPNAALVLADGTCFSGYGIGAEGVTAGEICFNTAMTGYQEILTDPSYSGQIITFTFPHIGNVGCNEEDVESFSRSPKGEPRAAGVASNASEGGASTPSNNYGACGLILREAITEPSNFRAAQHLDDWLKARGITGISGIDTRALTRHIRTHGAQNGAIGFESRESRVKSQVEQATRALAQAPDMNGLELAARVATKKTYEWNEKLWSLSPNPQTPIPNPLHVVALDYGVKLNILRHLVGAGCRVTVVPASTKASEVFALKPDGIFLSNGPGDPAATGAYAVPEIKAFVASGIPVFGICLGHQMLGLALGTKTEKMKQGHRGANHPVKDLRTNKVAITSQNHGFAISDDGLPQAIEITHRSLFDGTIQGISLKGKPVFSVQGHPEASPGPQDWDLLFVQFVEMMKKNKKRAA